MPGESSRPRKKKSTGAKRAVRTKAAKKATVKAVPEPVVVVSDPAVGLGRAITIRRLELGMTRTALATRAGLSYPYVAAIERGAKAPSAASLYALAGALDLTPGSLLDRADSLRRAPDDPITGEARRRVPRLGATGEPRAGTDDRERSTAGVGTGGPSPDPAAALAEVVRAIVRDELVRYPPGRSRSARPSVSTGPVVEPGALTPAASRADSRSDPSADTEDEVRAQVLQATRAMLDNDKMEYDTEGDLPIRRGDVMLFIRVLDDPSSVLVFSPVLVGVDESQGLFEQLNALNANMHFVRFCMTHGGVVVDLELRGDLFSAPLLEAACRTISEAAEAVGPDLQHDFGGRLFFGDKDVSPSRRGTAGYL